MASASVEAGFSNSAIEELLECAICRGRLNDPRVLSCQHYFCKKCLKGCMRQRNASTKTVKCAICRKGTKLTFQGVSGLPANYAVKGLLDLSKSRKVIEVNGVDRGLEKEKVTKDDDGGSNEVNKPSASKVANDAITSGGTTAKGKSVKSRGKNIARAVAKSMDSSLKDQNKNVASMKRKNLVMVHLCSSTDGSSSSDSHDITSDSESSDSDSSETTSDDSDDTSCSTLSDSDSEESYGSSDDSLPSSSMAFGNMTIGSEVYVFSKVRKPVKGILAHVKAYRRQLFAGVDLESNRSWIKHECEAAVRGTSLHQWWNDRTTARAVVHLDDCLPAAVVDVVM